MPGSELIVQQVSWRSRENKGRRGLYYPSGGFTVQNEEKLKGKVHGAGVKQKEDRKDVSLSSPL